VTVPVPALVLGLGNVLLHDEGAGVWVAESLRRRLALPASVTILEGGTLGLDLLPRLDGVERLLLIDAVRLGNAPGTLTRLEGDEVPSALDHKLSTHQIGVQDLLATASLLGRAVPHVVLLGVEPECLDPGIGFSGAVAEALPRLEALVVEELRHWGVPAGAAEQGGTPAIWWTSPGPGRPR
jgi:hydrogenase maturation protease